MRPSYEEAVSSWAAHLRSGGTTTWSAWQPTADPADSADSASQGPGVLHPLPDAVHLELVRRINLAAEHGSEGAPGGGGTRLGALADRVLATPAPGRGLIDVPLPWPTPRRFGTPPLDPAEVPTEELIRLAVGLLLHLLPDVPVRVAKEPATPWPAPWRRRFRLHGSPSTVAAVRRSLLAQGYVETDWRPTHVFIARPIDVMMAEHWSAAVRDGSILKWSATWRRAEAAGRLPEPIDLITTTRRLRDRRHEPLHVVVARDADVAAGLATGALRARPPEIVSSDDASVSDLLRRLNRLAALRHGAGPARHLARTLVDLLEKPQLEADRGLRTSALRNDTSPVTPPGSLPWARKVAATSAEELRRAGYAVHGAPDDLAPTEHRIPGVVDREHTLELAVTACLRTWHLGGNP